MHSEDDLRNVYNPNKSKNWWPSSSEDIRHTGRNGLAQMSEEPAATTPAAGAPAAGAPAAGAPAAGAPAAGAPATGTPAATTPAATTPAAKTPAAAGSADCVFPKDQEHFPQPLTIEHADNCTGFKIRGEPSSSASGRTPAVAQAVAPELAKK